MTTSKLGLLATLAAIASLSWSTPLLLSAVHFPSKSDDATLDTKSSIEEENLVGPGYRPLVRIAHAGGALEGQIYTNSLEALEANREYFEFFEIDFEFTADGVLVCLHDWEHTGEAVLGRRFDQPPSLAVFHDLALEHSDFTPCDIFTLGAWAEENPGKKIITDIKADNIAGLKAIADNQDLAGSVIPQVYNFDEIDSARGLGFDEIILTLYRFPDIPSNFHSDERLGDLFAITFPRHHVIDLGPKLKRELSQKTLILTHPISDIEAAKNVQRFGVDGIYTTLKN